MTYGRFSLEQWEKRGGDPAQGGNPFLYENGRWYRITDSHVIQGLGFVNYQAEECDPREVERWLQEHPTSPATTAIERQADAVQLAQAWARVLVAEEKDEPPEEPSVLDIGASLDQPALPTSGPPLEIVEPESEDDPELKPDWPDKPPLADFARDRGWIQGRIPNEIKEEYRQKFGDWRPPAKRSRGAR